MPLQDVPVDLLHGWIQAVADYGIELYTRKLSVPMVIEKRAGLTADLCTIVCGHFASDERAAKAIETLVRLRMYETDIVLAQIALLEDLHQRLPT